jgi:hypothetical protein
LLVQVLPWHRYAPYWNRSLENLHDFGRVAIMASALNYEKLIYKDEMKAWSELEGVEVHYP